MSKDFNIDIISKIYQFYEKSNGTPKLKDVIKMLSGKTVIPYDPGNPDDVSLLEDLKKAAEIAKNRIQLDKIRSKRVNEVGNYVEPCIREALSKVGYKAETPQTMSGRHQAAGYPDLVLYDSDGHEVVTYVECKTFNQKSLDSTQRTFYLSPSTDFKVTRDAHHFLISLEIREVPEERKGEERVYTALGWEVLDVANLELGLKMEFNASNKDMYSPSNDHILASSKS